jgi:hypothetical protein
MYKNIRDFVDKWAEERKSGLNDYRTNQFKKSVLTAAKVFIFLVILFALFQSFILGFYPEDFLILVLISASSFIFIPVNAIYMSSRSWKDNERLYEQCLRNLEKHSQENITTEKVRVEFPEYVRLKTLINLFYLSAISGISLSIFALINPLDLSLLIVLIPWISFFGIYRYFVAHFKNPACSHLIFDDSKERRHPEIVGTLGDNIRDIILYDQFKCFQCGSEYFVSKEKDKFYLEN